jgi:hypothetical protein
MEPVLEGNLTFTNIEQSKMLKADREKWQKYIKGSYKDEPKNVTTKGQATAFNAMYDASTLQLSPTEAYDVLLEARMIDRSITDKEFKWAIDKINNPYEKHVLEDMKAIVTSNASDFNAIFDFNDKSRNQRVNSSLITWVDEQLAKGKTPTRKDMYAMSSQFRVDGGTLVNIGQIIKRGGVQWEVVGFEPDGEPLVEIVE